MCELENFAVGGTWTVDIGFGSSVVELLTRAARVRFPVQPYVKIVFMNTHSSFPTTVEWEGGGEGLNVFCDNRRYIYVYFLAYTYWIHCLLAFWYQNFRQIFFLFHILSKYIFSVIAVKNMSKNFFKITPLTPIKKNSGTTVAICFLNFLVFIFLW